MSSSSRRKKDHASGGAGKVAGGGGSKVIPVLAKSMTTGKENSQPISSIRSATQKRNVQSMAQIDEPEAAAVEEPRVSKGTSSAPKGGISGRFEFSGALSDTRRNSRVSVQRKVNNANKCMQIDREISNEFDGTYEGQGVRDSIDLVKNGKSLDDLDVNYQENAKKKIKIESCNNEENHENLSLISSKTCTKKYTGKLHEKLAFLEDKVKRIAWDIKETKDMLDMENLGASKMILSDIHERIAGIEKAMGCDGDTEMGSVKNDENGDEEEEMDVVKEKIDAEVSEIQEVDNCAASILENSCLNDINGKDDFDALLMADEKLNEFDDQEKVWELGEEFEENYMDQLNDIGSKSSTAGWFVSEGESVILAHDDGSCSFYDIVNIEVKAEYKPPIGVSQNTWRDCWIIHTPGGDGCAGKYVVAASAGNSVDPGFCSWDFYTKDVKGFHIDDETIPIRRALAPLPNDHRNTPSSFAIGENRQWWYKPCGPLIISAASHTRMVRIYDIRDGDGLVKWELSKPVVSMDYASPLHWKSKGKVVIAELDGVSLWDVSGLSSCALQSVSSSGQRISALHVNNTDAERGGGVRQRISAAEAEGNDGVFCTPSSINVLDFRQPSGIGLKIPKTRLNAAHSVFSSGDSIFIGLVGKNHSSQIQHFSLRKHKLLHTHQLPESNAHHSFTALTQVWGNSSVIMGVCGLGLFVFDSFKENAKEVIGPNNMYSPSFDYLGSRVLIISRDRPASWRYVF